MNKKTETLATQVMQYLMKTALFLGLFFVVEYVFRVYAARNILLALLNIPLMLITPIALYMLIKKLRDQVLDGYIMGMQAWMYGVQLMFFAGLIEALFIYVYNEFIDPANLYNTKQLLIQQYEESLTALEQMESGKTFIQSLNINLDETLAQLKQMPVSTAIESAVDMLSSTMTTGMFLMLLIAPILKRKPSNQ